MENKEIRISNEYWQSAVPNQTIVHITPDGIEVMIDSIQDATRKNEAQIHEVKISELESKLMKAEYDLAEMERFTDDLIKQKVQDERERVINEIAKICQPSKPLCESNLGMESFKIVVLALLNSLKEGK